MFFAFFSTLAGIVVALTQYKVRTLPPGEDDVLEQDPVTAPRASVSSDAG